MKNKILIIMGVLCLTATSVLATGINVYFTDSSIKDRSNNTLNAGDYHIYKQKLEFFRSNPSDPTTSSGRMDQATVEQSYRPGGQHWYQLAALNGGTLYVRVWKDGLSGNRRGNYYGIVSSAVSSGATPPRDWSVSVSTDHKADVPYAPTVGNVSESMVRTGDTLELALVIPVGYNATGPDGIIVANSRSLVVTYPDGHTETKNGNSISLTNTPAGTYKFKPVATNWYGSTEGPEITYTTLGLGVSGPVSFDFDLLPIDTSKLVVNTVFLPDSSLAKAADLANVVNSAANDEYVTRAICKWNNETGQPIVALYDDQGALVNGSENFDLVAGESYQVYTTTQVTITLGGGSAQ